MSTICGSLTEYWLARSIHFERSGTTDSGAGLASKTKKTTKSSAVGALEHPRPRPRETAGTVAIREISQLAQQLVQSFGVAGTFLFLCVGFFIYYGTQSQKERLIEMVVFGSGIQWPIVVLSLTFVLVLWAQNYSHKKKVAAFESRLKEIAIEKNRLQELLAAKPLRHGEDFKSEEN